MRRKHGFNLLELSIVLGVIGLVIGGIYVAASSVMEARKITETQKQFLQLVANVKGAYATQPSFQVVSNTDAVKMGIMPAGIVYDPATSSYLNEFGGGVLIGDASNNGGQGFTIWFDRLPPNACVKIISSIVNGSHEVGGININGAEDLSMGYGANNNLDMNYLASRCGSQRTAIVGVYSLLR